MIRLALTDSEKELIDDIEYVGYGEIMDINHVEDTIGGLRSVQDELANMIKSLRHHKHFDKIIIHDGVPKYAEREEYRRGRVIKRRIKF